MLEIRNLPSMNRARLLVNSLGVIACIPVVACGGRSQSDSSWVAGDPLPPTSSVTAPASSTSVRSPFEPTTPVTPGPTPSQDVPGPGPSPNACGGSYEVHYPPVFTFGDHADMFEIVSPDSETWCLVLEEGYIWPSDGFRGSGFGLRFATTNGRGRDVPFDLNARGLTSVSFRIDTSHEDVLLAMGEVVNRPEPNQVSQPIWWSNVVWGDYHVAFSQVTGGPRRAFNANAFYGLQFHIFDELAPRAIRQTLCVSDVSFYDECGNRVIDARVHPSQVQPIPTDAPSTTAPPSSSTTNWTTTPDPVSDVASTNVDNTDVESTDVASTADRTDEQTFITGDDSTSRGDAGVVTFDDDAP
jgi:hypothetical protein